jgi:uncharacterized protein (UPF0335 family)
MEKELKKMMLVMYEIMGSKEFTSSIAKMLWALYQELKSVGFGDQQAMDIVINFAKSQSNK